VETTSTVASAASEPEGVASATLAPAPERDALVLDAVRVLVRATASEVAERSGQPNGSVSVALRGLVARGQVAKTRTARGAEYSLISTGSIQPFKRVRGAVAAGAPAGAATAGEPPRRAPAITAA
jgi:hypothetical protein